MPVVAGSNEVSSALIVGTHRHHVRNPWHALGLAIRVSSLAMPGMSPTSLDQVDRAGGRLIRTHATSDEPLGARPRLSPVNDLRGQTTQPSARLVPPWPRLTSVNAVEASPIGQQACGPAPSPQPICARETQPKSSSAYCGLGGRPGMLSARTGRKAGRDFRVAYQSRTAGDRSQSTSEI